MPIRGTLMLATTRSPIEKLAAGGPIRDWVAELTNQLAGRIKHKLLARGVDILISTPLILRGEHLAPLPAHPITPFRLSDADGGLVCVSGKTSSF